MQLLPRGRKACGELNAPPAVRPAIPRHTAAGLHYHGKTTIAQKLRQALARCLCIGYWSSKAYGAGQLERAAFVERKLEAIVRGWERQHPVLRHTGIAGQGEQGRITEGK